MCYKGGSSPTNHVGASFLRLVSVHFCSRAFLPYALLAVARVSLREILVAWWSVCAHPIATKGQQNPEIWTYDGMRTDEVGLSRRMEYDVLRTTPPFSGNGFIIGTPAAAWTLTAKQ